jgi:hypothetical protein
MTHADLSHLDRGARRRRWIVVLVAAVAFLLGIVTMAQLSNRADSEKQRADDATAAAEKACAQLLQLGYPCPFDPAKFRGATGAQGEQGPAGPQGRPPTEAEILAAVEVVYQRNRPADGRTPSAGELAVLVADYLVANPPPAGPSGPQGETGPPPTAEQVRAAVDAWFAANPLPVCPAGSHIEEYNPPLDKRTFLVCVKETPPTSARR